MAKKEETISLLDTFQEFKESKNIDRTTMISVLEESFRKVLVNLFGTDENFSVIVNPDRGDFEIQRRRVVVADKDVQDSNFEISLSEAQLIDETFEEGEEVSEADKSKLVTVDDGRIVKVTYEDGTTFILNYNYFDVTVEGVTVESYGYVKVS
jgi:hypothetical protein